MNPISENVHLAALDAGYLFVIDEKGSILEISAGAAAYFELEEAALGKPLLEMVRATGDTARLTREFGYFLSLCTGGDARCQNLRFCYNHREAPVPATLRLMRERREVQAERFLVMVQPDALTTVSSVLKPLQSLLETVISNARDGILIHDWFGTLLYANAGAAACLGFSSLTELLSLPASEIWERWEITGDAGKVNLSELPIWLADQGGLSLETTLHFRSKAEPNLEKWLTVCTSIAGDASVTEGGTAIFLLHDLTARRRSDVDLVTALQKQERAAAEIAGVLGQITDGVLITDAAGNLTFANAAARRIFGREPEETFDWNHHAGQIYSPEGVVVPPEELPMGLALLRGQVTENAEWLVKKLDGSEIWVQGSASPLTEANGQLIGAVMSLRDVTARRNMVADLERANRIKDDFLTIISHELRTPLTPMVGYVSLLRSQVKSDKPLNPKLLEQALDGLENNVQQQRKIVEELLDASRVLLGSARFQKTLYPLTALVSEVLCNQEKSIQDKKLVLHVTMETSLSAIPLDVSRMGQAIGHVLQNAWGFSEAGHRVWIDIRREGDYGVLEVRDEGKGIDPEFLPHVFAPFRQSDASHTRIHGGLGLGLAVVKAIVDAHDGTITLNSDGLGQGTTILIKLHL